MEKTLKRSIRRHHLERLKKNRSNYYGWEGYSATTEETQRHQGRLAHTARLCSCWMCGNPRKYQKEKTIHELSHIEFYKKCD